MIIEILEHRFPASVDKEQVEDFINNIGRPACEKAGYKTIRFAWTHIGGPMNMGIFIGELDSLADMERVRTVKKMQEAVAEFERRFPKVEVARSKIPYTSGPAP